MFVVNKRICSHHLHECGYHSGIKVFADGQLLGGSIPHRCWDTARVCWHTAAGCRCCGLQACNAFSIADTACRAGIASCLCADEELLPAVAHKQHV